MSSGFYHLYFIKDFLTPLQNAAFDAVSSYENLEPLWIAGTDAVDKFKNSSPKSCCFVFGKFTGPSYEHFKALGSAVFGPQALLDYLREEKPLPNVSFPLFSTALRNANVTVTSVAGQLREYLFSSIEMLHGIASRNLTDDVNVIISPKVGSKKYIVGAKRGIAIVTPEWIDEAWKSSEALDPIDMMASNFLEKYKLPMFNQLVVCVSGLTLDERKEVAKIVSVNGGQYSGEMKIGFTTHLIVKKAGGVKYNFAKKWKVQIVNDRWLTDSVNAGYALECSEYEVQDSPHQTGVHKHSTPTSSMLHDPSFLRDVSAITDSKTCDETRFSCLKDITNSTHSRFLPEQLYLCGCVILLYGCDAAESSRLSSIIMAAGGVSCVDASDKVTESFTHVVLGSSCKKIPPSDLEQNVHYVISEWLDKCREHRKRLPEDDFKPEFLNKTETPGQNQVNQGNSETRVDEEDIRLINEYFKDGNMADLDDFLTLDNDNNGNPEEQTVQEGEEKTERQQTVVDEVNDVHSQELDIPDEIAISREGLFSNLLFRPDVTFSITANPALCSAITDEGGAVINDSSVGADYTICPYILRQAVTPNMITPYWIHSCLAAKTLLISELDTEVGFHPVYIPASVPSLPLEGCAISLSGFVSNDRLFLTDLAKGLGATVQECFLRKPIPSRNLLASTHLVSARPDGRKFPAAQSWGIPAVSCSWLFACATAGKRVPESEHPVKENDPMVPKDWTKVVNIQKSGVFQTPHQTPKINANRQSIDGKMLKTPTWVKENQAQTPTSGRFEGIHVSPPMSEKVSRCLKQALLKSTMSGSDFKSVEDNSRNSTGTAGILDGVVICVARSLSDRQITLNDLAKQLGGDFRWNFDKLVGIDCYAYCILCILVWFA
ncbi:unnamed protein product [Rodentolepis nana]|uniref:DNA topoisomerase 2-binding protein 1 n=1 Tax=Rodentolepis nana TaxID=102285 RepID=A0A0R3TXK0_RODNA|nr:unnamed protein product [Rodentolepis nana]